MATDTIEVVCQCGRVTRVPSSSAGRSGRCKACGCVVQVPLAPDQDAAPSPVFVVEDEPIAPPKKAKANRPTDDDFPPKENAVHYLKAIEKHTRNISHCAGCLVVVVLLMFGASVVGAMLASLNAAVSSAQDQQAISPRSLKR